MSVRARNDTPSRRRSGRLETIGLFGGSALLVILAFWLASQFVQPAPPQHIRIATGQPSGAYYRYAQQYAKELAKHGITLEVLETNGTVDNLRLLMRDTEPAELALVQGGVADDEQRAALSGLGSMFYEPLWLVALADAPTRPLHQLAGARIGIGAEGSGSRRLATQLLTLNGIDDSNATLLSQPFEQSAKEIAAGELDLLFGVDAPASPWLHEVLSDPAIRVGRAPVHRSSGALLYQLISNPALGLQELPRAHAYARIDRRLTVVELPRGTLSPENDIPPQDFSLLAATANLVARRDIHPALVDLLLEAATAVHGGGSLLAAPGTFPSPAHSDFPLDPDAERHYKHGPPFLQRYLPFWAATWIDRTKVMLLPLVALLLPLIKVLPPVYAWRVRRRILRWYLQLRRIDFEIQSRAAATEAGVAALRERLARIESEAAQIDVPLGYTDQLYNLRLHIKLLEQKLESVGSHDAATP